MTDPAKDSTPPVTEEPEKVAEPAAEPAEKVEEKVAEAVEPIVENPPADTGEDADDDIPEWGKDLISKVETLADKLSEPVSDGTETLGVDTGDSTPVREPWHKRALFGGS